MRSRVTSGGRSRLLFSLALFIVAMVGGTAWAVSSPIGSSADDDFHLASIWCAWGREASGCEITGELRDRYTVSLPGLAGKAPQCYALNATVSGACQNQPEYATGAPGGASNGSYPAGFYSVMRIFVGPDATTSVMTMRIVSFAICALMLVGAALLLRGRERGRTLLVQSALAVPLGWFLFASTNPSGVMIAACVAFYLALVASLRARALSRTMLAGAAAGGYVLIAGATRPDGVYFTVFAALVAVATAFSPRRFLTRAGLLGAIPVAVAFVVSYLLRPRAVGTLSSPFSWDSALPNLSAVPEFYLGPYSTVLGWLDTATPSWVAVGRTIMFGVILGAALRVVPWRRWLTIGLAVALMIAVPWYIWQVGGPQQPRYILTLFLVLTASLTLRIGPSRPRLTRAQSFAIAGLAAVANAFALHSQLRRYVTGTDVTTRDLGAGAEWWWTNLPVGPDSVWLIGTLAGGTLLFGLALVSHGNRRLRAPNTHAPAPLTTARA